MLWRQQHAVQCQVVEKLGMHVTSDPNVKKEWMNFIFNDVPDNVSKNLVLGPSPWICLQTITMWDFQKDWNKDNAVRLYWIWQ